LIVGYLVVKLGFTTMMAGVQGKDSVDVRVLGAAVKFKGVTPGLLLGVLGVLVMAWSISPMSQFSAQVEQGSAGMSRLMEGEKGAASAASMGQIDDERPATVQLKDNTGSLSPKQPPPKEERP
jgi:hypothetical protein